MTDITDSIRMHASIFKTPRSEILLDVMEKHFAALKLPDLDNQHKLSRAVSFSELPSTRKIVIKQCYQSAHTPGIVRQYSCEEIFHQAANTREVKFSQVVKTGNNEQKKIWKTTFPYVNCFQSLDWNSISSDSVQPNKKPIESDIERMEIDVDPLDVKQLKSALSNITPTKSERASPPKELEVGTADLNNKQNTLCNYDQTETKITNEIDSLNATDKPAYQNIKLKYRSLVPTQTVKEPIKGMSSCSFWKVLFFVLLPILALIIAAIVSREEFGPMVVCSHSSDYFNATIELQEKVFGQRQAIAALSESLIRDTPCVKMIAILGGTGIGKSYSVDIIKRHFSRTYSIYEHNSPLTDKLGDKEFWPFTCNLVILENLNKDDLPYVVNCAKKFQSRENYCITILAVFNTEEVNLNLQRTVDLKHDLSQIRNSFQKEDINADVIAFEHLSVDTLRKCITYAAKENGITLSQSQVEDIKRGLLLSDTGCKGAYSKVQLLKRG